MNTINVMAMVVMIMNDNFGNKKKVSEHVLTHNLQLEVVVCSGQSQGIPHNPNGAFLLERRAVLSM